MDRGGPRRPERLGVARLIAIAGAIALLWTSFAHLLPGRGGPFGSEGVFSAIETGPILGRPLGNAILAFVLVQLALHALLAKAVVAMTRASRLAWGEHGAAPGLWAVLWLCVLVGWVLAANAWYYPRSRLAESLYEAVRAEIVGGIAAFHVVGVALALAIVVTIVRALRDRLRHRVDRTARARNPAPLATHVGLGAALGSLALAAGLAMPGPPRGSADGPTLAPNAAQRAIDRAGASTAAQRGSGPAFVDRPNLILIGIDSLRCDVTALSGADGLTPHVDAFLAQSVRFTDATTPLARTYPAWVSVLTGSHPHTTGAFINLLPPESLRLGETLPAALRRAGYRTTYAIDEVRFSNIDTSYGFDAALSPPIGAADFLLGSIGEAPLGNLLANTRLGAYLLPQLHANRAVATLYDPDLTVRRLARELRFDTDVPQFLALHLTLPHWPYVWSEVVPGAESPPETWVADRYLPAVRRVDRQFGEVLRMLEGAGALRNALVVLFSDHGEALGRGSDAPLAGLLEEPLAAFAPQTVTGHGTSVLSPSQYRVVLAVRGFGPARAAIVEAGAHSNPVTLEDLAPTLDELLGLGMPRAQFDGRSLAALLARAAPDAARATAAQQLDGRIRFTETEFNPRGFQPGEKQTPGDLQAAARVFRIDATTGRLQMRPELRPALLRDRQYAAFSGQHLLAALPSQRGGGFHYLYLPGPGALPRRVMGAPDPAADATLRTLWDALQRRFPMAFELSPPVALAGE